MMALVFASHCRMLQSVDFCFAQSTLESVILQEIGCIAALVKICFACGRREGVRSQLTVRPGFEPQAC